MAKRERAVAPKRDTTITQVLTPENRDHLYEWVSSRAPSLINGSTVPARVRAMAREILHRSHGVVVSSTMALSTAILALRGSGDFGADSVELSLLKAVLRYSEQYQVPPMVVMQLLADEHGDLTDGADKPD